MNFGKIRPQILLIILIAGGIALYALRIGNTEIPSGVIGGLVGLSLKLTEADD